MLLEVNTQLSLASRSQSDAASHSNTKADLSKDPSQQAASTPANNPTVREDTQVLQSSVAEILVYPSKLEYLECYLDGVTHSCGVEAQ